MLLEIQNGTVSRNGNIILSHFNFEIRGTEKAAIVGRNGAGKTTLLELLAGNLFLDPDEKHPDAKLLKSRSFSTAFLAQSAVPDPKLTVRESVSASYQTRLQNTGLAEDETGFRVKFDRLFTRLGFSKEDERKKLGDFSGGERTKIMLINAILIEPDVLLLDEPTNYLDIRTTEWLEQTVRDYRGAVIYVSHDRYFIDRTADTVWEIKNGRAVRYAGNYTKYREEKRIAVQRQEKAYEAQQKEIARLNTLIEKFKKRPRKAAFARSRKKILERMEHIERPDAEDTIRVREIIPQKPGSKLVLDVEHLLIGYQSPVKEVSFRLRRGQKVGIFGPNGTGKSTFLKTVAGRIPPFEGEVISKADFSKNGSDPEDRSACIKKENPEEQTARGKGDSKVQTASESGVTRRLRIGRNIEAAYFDQFTANIESPKNVMNWFHDRYPGLLKKDIRSYLAGFLFRGEDLGKQVSRLSGGEKSRLVLASLLYPKPNFLVLDEPTSHMDIPAMEAIEAILEQYRGTVLFVSHDRYFLNRIADSLLIFGTGLSDIRYCPYGYDTYKRLKMRTKSGESPSAMQSAEEQRLLDSFRSVPKKDHLPHELSTTAASFDWEFEENRKVREPAEERYRTADALLASFPQTPGEWEDWNSITEIRQKNAEKAVEDWTNRLIEWYDIWQDTPEGTEDPS